jgi:hypothetical protein
MAGKHVSMATKTRSLINNTQVFTSNSPFNTSLNIGGVFGRSVFCAVRAEVI